MSTVDQAIEAQLRDHYLFSSLDEKERDLLAGSATIREYRPETLLFSQGEVATCFYLIIKGRVRVYFATPDGREKTIRSFAAPQSFADAVIFMDHDQYPANAMTVTTCRLMTIRVALFREILASRPALYRKIIGHMIRHIQLLNQQLEMLSVMDSRQRLLHYFEQQLPSNWKNGRCYPLSMNKKALADYLAIRPETLSRILKQLEREKLLVWGRDGLTLIDWPPAEVV